MLIEVGWSLYTISEPEGATRFQHSSRLLVASQSQRLNFHFQEARHGLNAYPDFLWRYAKACHVVAQIEGARGDEEKKKQLLFQVWVLAPGGGEEKEKQLPFQVWLGGNKAEKPRSKSISYRRTDGHTLLQSRYVASKKKTHEVDGD